MRIFSILISFLFLAFIFTACESVSYQKTRGGVPYKIVSGGNKKDSIKVNYWVKFHSSQYIGDSLLGTTRGNTPQYVMVRGNDYSYGDPTSEIFQRSFKGDSIYFVQALDSFIKYNPLIRDSTIFRKGDQLVTTIRILDVFRTGDLAEADFNRTRGDNTAGGETRSAQEPNADAQAQMAADEKIIQEYLASNKISTIRTPLGAFVEVQQPGEGRLQTGDAIQVRYKVTNVEGETYDSGTFPMSVGAGGAIVGFEEGVKQFGKGGKGRVFVPSPLGYGPSGSGRIRPNEVLIFEIEILDVQPATGHSEGDGHNH